MQTPLRRARNLERYHKIVSVFARHGFGSALESLQLDRYLPLPPGLFKPTHRGDHAPLAGHLRLAFEELGPTFVKLGQILSTRPDIIPPEYIVELSKLQDGLTPASWEAMQALLADEYDCPIDDIFAFIDPQPLGSASLSQVHLAKLKDGSQVVLKIQRPQVMKTIAADLDILSDLAHLAERTAWGKLYHPVEIVEHFSFTLYNELDYRREGVNADRFRANFASNPSLTIPKVYWELSTARVLVLELVEGIKIDDIPALDAAGIDRHQVAVTAADIIAKEVLEDGFFHADPHPGNFFIQPGAQAGKVHLTVVDFGMVGYITKSDRMNMVQAIALAVGADTHGMVEHMLRIGAVPSQVDIQALERDLDRLLNHYRGLPLKQIQTARLVEEVMQVAFQYRISLPPDIWLLLKTLVMTEGLGRRLDPDFDLFSTLGPHVRRILVEMRLPWVWAPSLISGLESLGTAAKDIPTIAESLLRGLQRGQLPFSMQMGANKETLDRLDRVATRFSLSLLVAAFIVGLALLLPVATGSQVAMVLVVIGFVAALSLGVWVVFSILRAGR